METLPQPLDIRHRELLKLIFLRKQKMPDLHCCEESSSHVDVNKPVDYSVHVQRALGVIAGNVVNVRLPVGVEISYWAKALYGAVVLPRAVPAPFLLQAENRSGLIFPFRSSAVQRTANPFRLRTGWK